MTEINIVCKLLILYYSFYQKIDIFLGRLTLYIFVSNSPSLSWLCVVNEYRDTLGDFKSLSLGHPRIVLTSLPWFDGCIIVDFVTNCGSFGPGR